MFRMAMGMSVLLMVAAPAAADVIISSGGVWGYVAPNPPYEPEELVLEVTIGYGDPSNTIGGGLWHSGPGVYDLSNDPGWLGFLGYATNGIDDMITVTVTDLDGYQKFFGGRGWEASIFGRDYYTHVDLYPLEVTGVLLDVWSVEAGDPGQGSLDGIYVRYDFLGVPEPTSALGLLTLMFPLLLFRHGEACRREIVMARQHATSGMLSRIIVILS